MGRVTVVLLLSLLPLSFTSQGQARAAQETAPQTTQQTQTKKDQVDTEAAIRVAEEKYRQGEEAFGKGQKDAARRLFDQALETIHALGVDVRANPRFEAYYRDLVTRIHKLEATPSDELQETTELAAIDQVALVKDTELATVGPRGVKVFGRYDFDFSVAEPVLQYIEYFIAGRGRSTLEIGFERSGRYREMAEKIFKEEGVPLDLIWLAQAESVWKPNALSRAAAKGIWQFIPSTGLRYGLAQTPWIDDRSQPEKSTRAAARYLKWLNQHFAGDWLLAMAAYNSGEGRVDDAIARCGYADFWEIYKRGLLPQETRNYVPIILSIVIISKNQARYGINVAPDPPLRFDTFTLPSQTDLKVIADLIGTPFEAIQNLNPEVRRGVSPPAQGYTVRIPAGLKKNLETAYANLPEDQRVRKVVIERALARSSRPNSSYRTRTAAHKTRRGDTLSSLSQRYKVPINELARANGISTRGTLRVGQSLRIPTTKKSPVKRAPVRKTRKPRR
jgi:membrane-bound lytic murein transglycosylase D